MKLDKILQIHRFLKTHAKRCAYCGKKLTFWEDKTIDHMNPKCYGGCEKVRNKVVVCKECNTNKANLTFKEFRKDLNIENLLIYLEDFGDLQLPTGEHYALIIKKRFNLKDRNI